MTKWLNQHWTLLAWLVFILTRLFIIFNLPGYVRYFEEYANIWFYGLPPYLKHWFEYPPLTIPFISLPLYLDHWGWGVYRDNFRSMMIIVDSILFNLLLIVVKRFRYSNFTKLGNLVFYCLVTWKAKDFLYENLDLLFVISMFLPAISPLLSRKFSSWMTWLSYWLGVGIKLINVPLGFLYWLRDGIKKIWIPLICFLLLWVVPILKYRSALSVIIIYHKNRGLQAESLPALITRAINIFTQTETIYLSDFKSYDLKGPISNLILIISTVLFILAMLWWLIWVWKNKHQVENTNFILKATLVFIFNYLAFNKVFSTQYHLWYLPLLAVYPFANQKHRVQFFSLTAIFIAVATTRIPQQTIGPTDWATLIPIITQVPIGLWLAVNSYRLPVPLSQHLNKK